jgi:hypothetical protein
MDCELKNNLGKRNAYQDAFATLDPIFNSLGLAQPALLALVNLHVKQVSDLQKIDFVTLQKAHGIGPKALKALAQFYL